MNDKIVHISYADTWSGYIDDFMGLASSGCVVGISHLYACDVSQLVSDNPLGDTLYVTNDNAAYGYGGNRYGQFGNGTTTAIDSDTPLNISNIIGEKINKLSGGDFVPSYNIGLLTSSGSVLVAGWNNSGQLGVGDKVDRSTFTDITANFKLSSGEVIEDVYFAGMSGFALSSRGRVFTWGDNLGGQLGNGSSSDSLLPIDITANFGLSQDEKVIKIQPASGSVGGTAHVLALTNKHRVLPGELTATVKLAMGLVAMGGMRIKRSPRQR